jgi:hypothetical protein
VPIIKVDTDVAFVRITFKIMDLKGDIAAQKRQIPVL